MNIRLGKWARWFAPGWWGCARCKTPFRFVEAHRVAVSMGVRVAAMCGKCWSGADTDERIYYHMHRFGDRADWSAVRSAVIDER